ncbi:MAG TPA: alpha-L-rhamnosidase C-terminal domain-containing protein [Caulobacteraceae bacterium]|nr:alpha-L-rhamnosidase C-terminal domain-containing protein [Caulobacteraceae bacterium]
MTGKQRAPFVWSPRQPIDPQGYRKHYLGVDGRPNEKNRWFLFRKIVRLDGPAARAPLSITVDGRYLLYVNGALQGRGPVRCSPLFQRYDDYDLAAALAPGDNVIAVLAHTYGRDTAFYETTKGMWQPTFGDGGLWTEGAAETAAGAVDLSTQHGWKCIQSSAWTQDTPQSNHSLGFIEDVDADRLPAKWTEVGFDDGDWDDARPLLTGGEGPESTYGGLETRPFPILLPRGIPMLEERRVAAQRIVWIRGLIADPGMPFHRRCYEEALVEAPPDAVRGENDLLRLEGGRAVVRTEPGRDVTILLDFGKIMTGRPCLEIEARGGEVVEIACAESLPGEWRPEGLREDARLRPKPWLGADTHLFRYRAKAGVQTFERFEWCAIRWMQLTVRDAPDGVVFRGLGANLCNYPVEQRGRFTSSDPVLDQLWATGAYTLRQCMHDAWEDCPSREQRQWLGDVTVENLAGWAAFGPSVAPLTAKFLSQAAESQRPDGLTQMFAPGDHRTDGLLIPDWTLQWILAAGDHWRYAGDLPTIAAIFPSIVKALAWFERLLSPAGLVADMPYWHFMDWAGVGRYGEAAALNAQLAGAFAVAAELAAAVGWPSEAERFAARGRAIGAALQTRHWDARRCVFVDVVDPATGEREPRVSQHGNAAIALWTDAPADRIGAALNRITDSNRLTFTPAPPIAPTGDALEPEEGVVLANTFYSHFVYAALARHGRLGEALRLMRERYGPMLARGATTLWESFEPTASLCHGFSATPTYQLSRHILGVAPAAPGFASVALSPDLADLDHAEGLVPTPRGEVEARLERTADGFVARYRLPAGLTARVAPPPGLTLATPSGLLDGEVELQFERT